jgi:hypothetical protein
MVRRASRLTRSAAWAHNSGYIERLNELSDRNWAGNSGVDETNRLGEIEDIKTRLQNMELWDAQYIQRIAEGEEIFRKKKELQEFKRAAEQRQSAVTNRRELQALNSLIARSFNPTCDWDRKHTTELITLALWPDRSTRIFRLRNSIHMLMHRH